MPRSRFRALLSASVTWKMPDYFDASGCPGGMTVRLFTQEVYGDTKIFTIKRAGHSGCLCRLTNLEGKGGEAPGRDVVAAVEQRAALDDWATATYAKSGYVRWQSILHFYSIDCIKAGYLVKKKGVWYLTAEGEAARKLGDVGLLNAVTAV